MADPASSAERAGALDQVARLALAALGAVALTGDRVEQLADDLSTKGGMGRDDARRLIEERIARWRGEATRKGSRAQATLATTLREVGLASREEVDELELRVAQLEHRLRLLEPPSGA